MNTRVAIIEDNASLRRIICGWIEQEEKMTLAGAFESAESALHDLPELQPDVVLVDINLPGANGIECVSVLKPQLPATQFMMLTVYEDTERIFLSLAAGATGYLLKRACREQLFDAIAEVRNGGSPMSAQIARKVVQSFQQPVPTRDDSLSSREREILQLLVKGLLYKEIAGQLGISVYTINAHVRRIYEKLHVHSRSQAVAKFRQL